jgi:hypothetical protein
MERRHMDALNDRFDELINESYTSVKEWEIKSWFGFERLRENAWRTLRLRWSERCREQGYVLVPKLNVVSTPGGFLLTLQEQTETLEAKTK